MTSSRLTTARCETPKTLVTPSPRIQAVSRLASPGSTLIGALRTRGRSDLCLLSYRPRCIRVLVPFSIRRPHIQHSERNVICDHRIHLRQPLLLQQLRRGTHSVECVVAVGIAAQASVSEVFKVVVASTIRIQAAFSSWFRGCELALFGSARSRFR